MGAAFCKIAVWKYWPLGSALIQKHHVNSPTLMYSPGNNKWFWKVPVRYCPGHRMILSFGSWWIPLCGGESSQTFLSRFVCAELVGWGCSTGRHPAPPPWRYCYFSCLFVRAGFFCPHYLHWKLATQRIIQIKKAATRAITNTFFAFSLLLAFTKGFTIRQWLHTSDSGLINFPQ